MLQADCDDYEKDGHKWIRGKWIRRRRRITIQWLGSEKKDVAHIPKSQMYNSTVVGNRNESDAWFAFTNQTMEQREYREKKKTEGNEAIHIHHYK